MEEFAEFLGWAAVWCFIFLLMNYILKWLHKKYSAAVSAGNQATSDRIYGLFRKILQIVVKYHKMMGFVIAGIVLLHLTIMWRFYYLSNSGLVAMTLLFIVIFLGIIDAYLNTSKHPIWKSVHRIMAFLALIAIIWHID